MDMPHPPIAATARRRRAYRVPSGLPAGRDSRRAWVVLSVLLHVAVVGLLFVDLGGGAELVEREQGAGGPGPAGGGGGGNRGSGSQPEAIRYMVAAPAPAPTPIPETPRPPVEPEPLPQLRLTEAPTPELPAVARPLPLLGIGGGTGTDGTSGTGPGTGGGIGTGVGTGTGSSVGSGTGGGGQENYPPTPIEMFIPPLPVPSAARGTRVIAEFDVDETGRVRGIEFTQTRDRGYNRRLRDALEGYRFRAGTRPDGTPIRMKAQITIDLP